MQCSNFTSAAFFIAALTQERCQLAQFQAPFQMPACGLRVEWCLEAGDHRRFARPVLLHAYSSDCRFVVLWPAGVKKLKASHTRCRALGPELIPV